MKSPTRFSRSVLAAVFAMALSACGSVEYRQDYQSLAVPIEVIDSNYVESTYDTEIVYTETPWQIYAAAATIV